MAGGYVEPTECGLCGADAGGYSLCPDCRAYVNYLAHGGGVVVLLDAPITQAEYDAANGPRRVN